MSQPYVLVVDPNPTTARRVQDAIAGSGFGLIAARDAQEAAAASAGHDLAVVLSSAALPRGNGYDLARQIREDHPAAAIFLLAGGFEVYNRQRAADAGVTGQVRKPFTVESLRAHLEQVLGPLGGGEADDTPESADDDAPVPELTTAAIEPLVATDPVPPVAPPSHGAPPPPTSDERVASFLPRDYQSQPPVSVDPDIVGPALERAILDVLPEVVQRILRHSLATQPTFRDLVEVAVEEAVRAQLPEIAERVVRERLREREQRDEPVD